MEADPPLRNLRGTLGTLEMYRQLTTHSPREQRGPHQQSTPSAPRGRADGKQANPDRFPETQKAGRETGPVDGGEQDDRPRHHRGPGVRLACPA